MTTEEFREKAKKGGWKEAPGAWETSQDAEDALMLLDPKAWEAVAKTEKWGNVCGFCLDTKYMKVNQGRGKVVDKPCVWCSESGQEQGIEKTGHAKWLDHFYNLPKARVQGKTIEEFLKTLCLKTSPQSST